jgi:alcohol dehydrogenase class IV
MDFNRSAAEEKFALVGEALGAGKDSRKAVKHVFELNEQIGIPARLSMVGVTDDAVPNMSKDAMQSGNILVNPRETKLQDIEALYRAAL